MLPLSRGSREQTELTYLNAGSSLTRFSVPLIGPDRRF